MLAGSSVPAQQGDGLVVSKQTETIVTNCQIGLTGFLEVISLVI